MPEVRTNENSQVEAQWAFTSFARTAVAKAALGLPYRYDPEQWRKAIKLSVERALNKAKPDCVDMICEVTAVAPDLERVTVRISGYDAYFKTIDFEGLRT